MSKSKLRFVLHLTLVRIVQSLGVLSIPFLNLLLLFLFKKIHFEKRQKEGASVYCVREFSTATNSKVHYYHFPQRSHIYFRGISRRGSQLAMDYGIDKVNLVAGDIVLDVGANSGDLLIYLDSLNIPLRIFCFEPDPNAYSSLKLNCGNMTGVTPVNLALGNVTGSSTFYLSSLEGDSSLSEPPVYSKKILIESITLDRYLTDYSDINLKRKIKLLKLEAEGFEPEVLEGASNTLQRISYIAADLGWERGKLQECTIPQVVNFLLNNNFAVESVSSDGVHYLFRNLTH